MEPTRSVAALIDNKQAVPKEFNKIAARYDFATGLSQGYQEDLERSAGYLGLTGSETVLDLCCGTGRSTQAVLQYLTSGKVIGVDNSEQMLVMAKRKFAGEIENGTVEFHLQDAMHLDFGEQRFSHIFMAYGLRNMPDYATCVENLYHLLEPGGKLVIHDYSLAIRWYARPMWWVLGYLFIVPVSALTTGSSRIFSYLVKSVLQFLTPPELETLLLEKKFREVASYPQKSWRAPILRTFTAIR